MPDSYDVAIDYFWDHRDEIDSAWNEPEDHRYGYLFSFLTPNRSRTIRPDGRWCGCPTTVRLGIDNVWFGQEAAWTDELTKAIQSDEKIPKHFGSSLPWVQFASLPAIANAQRLADRMLGRPEPNTASLDNGAGV